jgi:hypothetical protein
MNVMKRLLDSDPAIRVGIGDGLHFVVPLSL